MLEERTLYLINAEIDDALEAGDRAELDSILESSAEARAVRAELQRLATLLDTVPEQDPPADLPQRILERMPAPRRRPAFSLASLFASFQPAPTAAAFAAGLLVAVGFYELAWREQPASDLGNMVGTMVAHRGETGVVRADRVEVTGAGVTGTMSLGVRGEIVVLEVALESSARTEIVLDLAGSGLRFGGIAHPAGGTGAGEFLKVSGGTLRVESQGQQAFSVFLQQTANGKGRDREIQIAVSSAGQPVFSGALRG